jgi:hypothetical protein
MLGELGNYVGGSLRGVLVDHHAAGGQLPSVGGEILAGVRAHLRRRRIQRIQT